MRMERKKGERKMYFLFPVFPRRERRGEKDNIY